MCDTATMLEWKDKRNDTNITKESGLHGEIERESGSRMKEQKYRMVKDNNI